MKNWLFQNYQVEIELPLDDKRRLDAAIWFNVKGEEQRQGKMDIALEWEWDNNKVAKNFPYDDFLKLFEVDAQCGLAIVQTKVYQKGDTTQADTTVKDLQRLCKEYRRDSRSVVLIEIRRVLHQKEQVEFLCYFQDLATPTKQEIAQWQFP